ncbi:MAG TPA: hypothetical protein VN038_06495 [Dyadobacter sp.]|nr:hypothetical protein [Dyadobacter sp.]
MGWLTDRYSSRWLLYIGVSGWSLVRYLVEKCLRNADQTTKQDKPPDLENHALAGLRELGVAPS